MAIWSPRPTPLAETGRGAGTASLVSALTTLLGAGSMSTVRESSSKLSLQKYSFKALYVEKQLLLNPKLAI